MRRLPGIQIGDSENRLRITSWTSRGKPVVDIIVERLPQTLWVVGSAYLLSLLIAVPLGIYAAYRQNSMFDQVSSIVSVIGFSLPTFFTGVLLIQIFAVWLGWFPTLYNTTLRVNRCRYVWSTTAPDGHAGRGAGILPDGDDQPLYPLLGDREPAHGLCAHGAL